MLNVMFASGPSGSLAVTRPNIAGAPALAGTFSTCTIVLLDVNTGGSRLVGITVTCIVGIAVSQYPPHVTFSSTMSVLRVRRNRIKRNRRWGYLNFSKSGERRCSSIRYEHKQI
jgi:hypothetical protein